MLAPDSSGCSARSAAARAWSARLSPAVAHTAQRSSSSAASACGGAVCGERANRPTRPCAVAARASSGSRTTGRRRAGRRPGAADRAGAGGARAGGRGRRHRRPETVGAACEPVGAGGRGWGFPGGSTWRSPVRCAWCPHAQAGRSRPGWSRVCARVGLCPSRGPEAPRAPPPTVAQASITSQPPWCSSTVYGRPVAARARQGVEVERADVSPRRVRRVLERHGDHHAPPRHPQHLADDPGRERGREVLQEVHGEHGVGAAVGQRHGGGVADERLQRRTQRRSDGREERDRARREVDGRHPVAVAGQA